MAEIIDVLTPLQSQCPAFTVVAPATAGYLAVEPAYPVTPNFKMYVDGPMGLGVYGRFQSRDNIRLLTAGFYIPESFTLSNQWYGASSPTPKPDSAMAANELVINVFKSDGTTNTGPLPGLGARGVVGLPFANYEMAFDIFCDMSKAPPTGVSTFNNTVALPVSPAVGDTYKALVTANGWTANRYYEWSGAAWIDVSGVALNADNEFYLGAQLITADVSMIGVPSLLNGQVIQLIPFIKVLHSLPIIA